MVIKGKQKVSLPRRNLVASATTKANVEKAKMSVNPLALPFLHRRRQRETEEIILRKVELPEKTLPSGRKFQKPCQKYVKETCTDPSRNYWHAPECQKQKKKKAAVMARDDLFYIQKKANSITKDQTNIGKLIKVPLPWFETS